MSFGTINTSITGTMTVVDFEVMKGVVKFKLHICNEKVSYGLECAESSYAEVCASVHSTVWKHSQVLKEEFGPGSMSWMERFDIILFLRT